MKNTINLFVIILLVFIAPGCLLFNTASYNVNIYDDGTGDVQVVIQDIRTDAESDTTLSKDKDMLFNYMLKSDEFLQMMKKRGDNIQSRSLYVDGNKLNAKVFYKFNNISDVENMQKDKDFYYLTLQPTDSVVSTNGEVITTAEHKRILWKRDAKNIKFEMLGTSYEGTNYKSLKPYYHGH
jgi:hypothetical protein